MKLVEEDVPKEAKAFGIQLVRFLPVLTEQGDEKAANRGPARTVRQMLESSR
jgi:hypothetical protein